MASLLRPALRERLKRHKKKLIALALILVVPTIAHLGVAVSTRIEPPALADTPGEPTITGDLRALGPAYARHRGRILEVRLVGAPEVIGHQHGRLLYKEMVANEGTLYDQFKHYVPIPPLRWLLVDVSRVQYRGVDLGMPEERRLEIAAQARAFSPDPFDDFLPTYHRFVFLQSLYDIALSFEHSPLIGCTSLALTDGAFEGGHAVLARNFDFEAGSIFDVGKAIFLVREEGRIPYASIAWPGLIGAVSGMNAEGLALVVHGARAREPQTTGEPVVHTMRELLGKAKNVNEAIAILEKKGPMVSHLVMLVDASGEVAIAERAPGEKLHARRSRGKVPLTNHFEGPLSNDPSNRIVETVTSTRPRRMRLDELLSNLRPGATVQEVVGVLRDRRGVGGVELSLGDRKAIDALIATHGVVMDTTARSIWVSEGPHLVGRFIRFDVGKLLDPAFEPKPDDELFTIPEDEIKTNGAYDAWVGAGEHHGGER